MAAAVLSSLLFAVSANIDSVVVGLSLGLKNIKIGFHINLLIACILSAVTVLSVAAGGVFQRFVPEGISSAAGGGLLILIGLYSLYKVFFPGGRKKSRPSCLDVLETPEKADKDSSGYIDAKESVILAAVLSLNNLGMGIGAGLAGLDFCLTAAFSFGLSVVFLSAGCWLGKRLLPKAFGTYASAAAALLIILLGVCEAAF